MDGADEAGAVGGEEAPEAGHDGAFDVGEGEAVGDDEDAARALRDVEGPDEAGRVEQARWLLGGGAAGGDFGDAPVDVM